MLRTIWNDPDRFVEQYWSKYEGMYLTGDSAKRDEDGYYWIIGRVDDAKISAAQSTISNFKVALQMYKLDNGLYPSTEQGLQALVEPPTIGRPAPKWREGGYLEKRRVPKDPWDYDYIYLSPGGNSDFDLSSYGADGEPGGEGADKDINNWELE